MQPNESLLGNNEAHLEIPVGLGMQLAQAPEAMTHFGNLSKSQQETLIHYVQSGATGEDAKRRVDQAVESLKKGDVTFLQ